MGHTIIDYDYVCDKTGNKVQAEATDKLRSNMAMSQGNGKNEYSPCNL